MSLVQQENQTLRDAPLETQNVEYQIHKSNYAICNKKSFNENQTIIEYLYEEGKCGEICWDGKQYRDYYHT